MGAYLWRDTFLSQIFDDANTDLEKRSIFFKHLLPQLEFSRDLETIDLSKVTLTHHALKRRDAGDMRQGGGEAAKLQPMTGAGTGQVQEPQRVYMAELIEKVNSLFDGELTDGDKLRFVNTVILGKMLESETLAQQAANNSKEQSRPRPT